MPSLSYAGRVSLFGSIAMSLGGLLGGVGPVTAAGAVWMTGIAVSWAASVAIPRRMRRERLEFTWWIPPRANGPWKPDERVPLCVTLRNPTGDTLVFGSPRLALSPGMRHTRRKHHRVRVPPRSVATFELEVRPSHAGRHLLHGAWMTVSGPLGVAWAPLYFPNPIVLEVAPRAATGLGPGRLPPLGPQAASAGRAARRTGEGTELRELRDYQPGDPYRRIAWKASARRGKLVVRENEDEVLATRVLVIDASATMRGDDRGGSRLDYALEMVAQSVRMAAATGDRLGLVAFDRRVVASVPPGEGTLHARALLATAVDLRALVDEDLTDVDDDGLVDTVARYFREQEGIDAFRGVHAVEARRRLAALCERAAGNDPVMRQPVRARDAIGRTLRSFCRARAIPLPLRHDSQGTAKSQGLAAALHAAVAHAREPRTVLVVSDLDAVGDFDTVRLAVGAARQRHHRVSFVAPAGRDFIGRAPVAHRDARAHAAVVDVFLADERMRLRASARALAPAGVTVALATASDPAAHWFRRAAAPRAR